MNKGPGAPGPTATGISQGKGGAQDHTTPPQGKEGSSAKGGWDLAGPDRSLQVEKSRTHAALRKTANLSIDLAPELKHKI